MSLYSQNKTNNRLENEGVWFDLRKNNDGTMQSFKIARMSMANTKYAASIRRIQKQYKKMLQLDILPPETADRVSNEAFVETVLLDWRNISHPVDDKGVFVIFEHGEPTTPIVGEKPFPFNKDNALKLIVDLPDVYKVLESVANEAEAYRATALEADAKN
jgi:hypothetical protein